jgi:hypothetical protein
MPVGLDKLKGFPFNQAEPMALQPNNNGEGEQLPSPLIYSLTV